MKLLLELKFKATKLNNKAECIKEKLFEIIKIISENEEKRWDKVILLHILFK